MTRDTFYTAVDEIYRAKYSSQSSIRWPCPTPGLFYFDYQNLLKMRDEAMPRHLYSSMSPKVTSAEQHFANAHADDEGRAAHFSCYRA